MSILSSLHRTDGTGGYTSSIKSISSDSPHNTPGPVTSTKVITEVSKTSVQVNPSVTPAHTVTAMTTEQEIPSRPISIKIFSTTGECNTKC